jgi:hypothetical protein
MDFTRLEIRDILANIDQEAVDPEVLAKLQEGAAKSRLVGPVRRTAHLLDSEFRPTTLPPGNHNATLDAVTMPEHDTGYAVLTDRLIKDGWTQEDIDRINADKEKGRELNERLAAIKPIVGEENASNIAASFAGPDIPPAPPPPSAALGQRNQYGDLCAAITKDGQSAFQCKDCGKGYTYNRNVGGGCPFCFLNGGGSSRRESEDDEGRVEGQDSDW